jgi:hypothetical protein
MALNRGVGGGNRSSLTELMSSAAPLASQLIATLAAIVTPIKSKAHFNNR